MTDAISPEQTQGTPAVAAQAAGDAAGKTAGVAAEQSRNVASSAAEQAKTVASQATSQASSVTEEARQQAGRVVEDASTELRQQLEQRFTQLVQSTRGASDQLRALHEGRTDDAGRAGDLAGQASDKLGQLAERADGLGVQGVTQEVAAFARRRPLAFLAAAAVAGVAAGRMMRGVQAVKSDADASDTTTGDGRGLPSSIGPADSRKASLPASAEVGTLGGPTGAVLPEETGLGASGPALGDAPLGANATGGVS